ncbi:MAG: di-heme oxidoredictase family protein [Gemmatimonadota bacterium]
MSRHRTPTLGSGAAADAWSAPRVRTYLVALAPALALVAGACGAAPDAEPAATIGEPVTRLSDAELERFALGRVQFDRIFTPEEGLGPLFNENQCSACHTDPASGGTGEQLVRKATRFSTTAGCDPLAEAGGENVRSQATPALEAHGVERQPPPEGATERARFTTPFLFGLGLVEAVPDETLLENADPDDADGDGISGRVGRDAAGRVARFGRKADVATLADFVASALLLEMGLTSPRFPAEPPVAELAPLLAETDPALDPEVDAETVALLTDYVRFLAPPPRRLPSNPDELERIDRGEGMFHAIGCGSCHTPSLRTAPSDVAAFDRREVRLYSDLLLHDMGPELAGTCGPAASPREWRTEPLMGLGRREAYLHDGRTYDLREAILLHGGEATAVRAAFEALGRVRQEAILRFLRTL